MCAYVCALPGVRAAGSRRSRSRTISSCARTTRTSCSSTAAACRRSSSCCTTAPTRRGAAPPPVRSSEARWEARCSREWDRRPPPRDYAAPERGAGAMLTVDVELACGRRGAAYSSLRSPSDSAHEGFTMIWAGRLGYAWDGWFSERRRRGAVFGTLNDAKVLGPTLCISRLSPHPGRHTQRDNGDTPRPAEGWAFASCAAGTRTAVHAYPGEHISHGRRTA